MNLERIACRLRGGAQLFDGLIDLIGDEEVEPQHVMRGLAGTAPIHPAAVLQLVPLPRLADDQAGQEREEDEEGSVGAHQDAGVYSRTTASHRPCARSTSSISSRTAPRPPLWALT